MAIGKFFIFLLGRESKLSESKELQCDEIYHNGFKIEPVSIMDAESSGRKRLH